MKKRRVAPVSLWVCLMSATLLFQDVARAQDAAAPATTLSCTEMETYLTTAKVVSQKSNAARSVDPNRLTSRSSYKKSGDLADQIPHPRQLPIAQAPPARHPRPAPEFLPEHLPGTPLRRTNRMPVRHARSETRGFFAFLFGARLRDSSNQKNWLPFLPFLMFRARALELLPSVESSR